MRVSAMRVLASVEGITNKFNDIIYHESPKSAESQTRSIVCYFGGDVQDLEANMTANSDNAAYSAWSLERTCKLLAAKFARSDVMVVRADRYHRHTYACFDHFVRGDSFGAPKHQFSHDSLSHLRLLLMNSHRELNLETIDSQKLILIGFSKGCVVLNQFLYAFVSCGQQSELREWISRITDMYWLDGGHSGGGNTWITAQSVLTNFCSLKINAHIHVTPYQIECQYRPWIAKEEHNFYVSLINLGVNVERVVHFQDEEKSLKIHFKVLNDFIPIQT